MSPEMHRDGKADALLPAEGNITADVRVRMPWLPGVGDLGTPDTDVTW